MTSIAEVRTTEAKQLAQNVRAVVADLIQRNNHTAESFAQLTGTSRVMLQRKLDGALPFKMSDLVAMYELGWSTPSQIFAAAERGELYPQPFGEQSLPLAKWSVPAWSASERVGHDGVVAELSARRPGYVIATLNQTDDFEIKDGSYSIVRQPVVVLLSDGVTDYDPTSIEDARALITGPESNEVPMLSALTDVLKAYDEATR